ncbi:hypothetical protein F3Y22_tig00116989pilonHSYRG00349 [Hibiscus syriacus]|uniref:GOST seven transmembrane domain-containing protein n=1 Tax=Hibiscus syriacus TaxID=106335 RepID=A0A6A2WFW6_HIBSY|nr:hypothetical protein F3Y22_tig00116989pilonHSYRG00349 [Hibiscus syriacus]
MAVIGHLHLLRGPKPAHIILSEMADKYGPIFTIKMGFHKALIVSDHDCIFYTDKEKKVLMIVIPLQVVANVAQIVIDETRPFGHDWVVWKRVFLLFYVICCCAVLFPIVWSIKNLREAAKTDGKLR